MCVEQRFPNIPLQVTHISRVGGNLQLRKEDVRANVFKPTVALPTVTVEQFGEFELERMRNQQVNIQIAHEAPLSPARN